MKNIHKKLCFINYYSLVQLRREKDNISLLVRGYFAHIPTNKVANL